CSPLPAQKPRIAYSSPNPDSGLSMLSLCSLSLSLFSSLSLFLSVLLSLTLTLVCSFSGFQNLRAQAPRTQGLQLSHRLSGLQRLKHQHIKHRRRVSAISQQIVNHTIHHAKSLFFVAFFYRSESCVHSVFDRSEAVPQKAS